MAETDWHIRLEEELLACPDLTLTQKVHYAYMRFRQGTNTSTWRSYTMIAAELGVSVRTAKRTNAELEQIGLTEVSKGGGRGKANDYRVVPFTEWAANRAKLAPITEPLKGDKLAPISGRKGDKLSNKGCQVVQKRVTNWHSRKNKEKEQEKEQGVLSSHEGLALLAQLRTCLRSDGDCETGLRNAAQWAHSQSPDVQARVLTIARESGHGKPPYRLWMHRLKMEMGYVPPSNGRPKPRGAAPEPIGACVGRLVAGIGRDHIDRLHDRYSPARFAAEGGRP